MIKITARLKLLYKTNMVQYSVKLRTYVTNNNLDVWFVVAKQIRSTVQVTNCLWTHVIERSNNLVTRDTSFVRLDCFRNTKVNQLQNATSYYKICRFQVRMYNSCTQKTYLMIIHDM